MSKPGEKALLAFKEADKKVQVFKKPEAPKERKKKSIILTEEQYMEVKYDFSNLLHYFNHLHCSTTGTRQNYSARFLSRFGKTQGSKRLPGCDSQQRHWKTTQNLFQVQL
jgi:hypothetical protein